MKVHRMFIAHQIITSDSPPTISVQNCQNPSYKQWRFIANDPSFPFNSCSKLMVFRLFHPSVLDKPHLFRQAGTIRRTAQGCMERHCQGCSTIFHPIGVQAIADDHDIRLFFMGKWGMWRKRDEQKWQNLNNNGTFSFSFGGVV